MAKDMVNHPDHYTATKYEVIDIIEAFTDGLVGIEATDTENILKYMCRWKHKNGLEDLKKARWYLNHLINKVENSFTEYDISYCDEIDFCGQKRKVKHQLFECQNEADKFAGELNMFIQKHDCLPLYSYNRLCEFSDCLDSDDMLVGLRNTVRFEPVQFDESRWIVHAKIYGDDLFNYTGAIPKEEK